MDSGLLWKANINALCWSEATRLDRMRPGQVVSALAIQVATQGSWWPEDPRIAIAVSQVNRMISGALQPRVRSGLAEALARARLWEAARRSEGAL